jgi:hypothetical protein
MQSRRTSSSAAQKHENNLLVLIDKADDQARKISNQSGYRAVKEFVDIVEDYLTVVDEDPGLELDRFSKSWEQPAATWPEQLAQLKRFRKKLCCARTLEEFSRIDQLHLRHTLTNSACYYNSLTLSPVVRAHQERVQQLANNYTFELANLEGMTSEAYRMLSISGHKRKLPRSSCITDR